MAGVNIKMGVDVSQFKQGMQQAQQSAKTLNAQMKANEAQFKATGDKEKYLTEKGKLLKQQLEEQKKAASNAEKALDAMRKNGVEKTSAEYQKMEQALANAQAAMYDAQASMNTLTVSEEKASKGASDLSNSLNSIGKKVSFDAVINGIDKITGGLEKAAGKVIDIGQGIWDEMMKSAQWADDTATMALMYEVPLKDLLQIQALVASGLDTTVDAILGAQVKMRRGVGNGSIADDLEKIGVSMETVIGQGKYGPITQMKDSVALFWEAGQALMNLSNEYDKETAAQAIFGKSWRELLPLFTEYHSQEEFAAAMAATNTNTEEEVNELARLNDKIGELEHNFDVLKNKVLAGLAPALTRASEVLSELLGKVLEYLDTPEGQQALKDMETAVSGLFEDLSKIDPEHVVAGFTEVFNKIVSGLQWMNENQETLGGLLVGIVSAWGAAKLAGGALTVLQLVNGLIDLKNTKSIKIPDIHGNGGTGAGGNNTVSNETVSSQSVQNANITNASVTNDTITNATITNGTFTNGTFSAVNTATENVTTMYVQNMIGGNGTNPTTPTAPNNPVISNDGSGGYPSLPYSPVFPVIANDGSGGFSSLPYYAPTSLPSGGDFNLDSGGGDINLNLPSGGDGPTLNLPSGGNGSGEPYRLNPSDYDITDGTATIAQIAAMKAGHVAQTLSVFDPAGASALMIPWVMDKTKFGQTLSSGGSFFDAASASAEVIRQAPGNIAKSYQSWADDLWRAVTGKDTKELGAWLGKGLKDAGTGVSEYAQEKAQFYETLLSGDVRPFQALEGAIESVKTEWEEFTNDVNTFVNNVPDIVMTFKMIYDKNSERYGYDPRWFNQPNSFMNPAQRDRVPYMSHANGLFSVPWDGYPAILHKGERVLTAREADRYTTNNYFGNVNLNNGLEIEALTDSIDRRNRRQRSGYGA